MTMTAHRPTTAPLPAVSPGSRRLAVPRAAAPADTGERGLSYLVSFVLSLAVVGALLAAVQLTTTVETAGSSPQQPVLRTPYGLLAVGDVTVSVAVDASKGMVGKGTVGNGTAGNAVAGKGHAAHTGAASGAAGVRVNVPVTLQNDSDAAVRYTPEQFRLVTGTGQPAGPEDSALLTGELRPGAAVALRLTFALPAGATSARLTVDSGRPTAGLDLSLPAASTPGQQMTPQDQPAEPAQPAQAPDGADPAEHDPSDTSHH